MGRAANRLAVFDYLDVPDSEASSWLGLNGAMQRTCASIHAERASVLQSYKFKAHLYCCMMVWSPDNQKIDRTAVATHIWSHLIGRPQALCFKTVLRLINTWSSCLHGLLMRSRTQVGTSDPLVGMSHYGLHTSAVSIPNNFSRRMCLFQFNRCRGSTAFSLSGRCYQHSFVPMKSVSSAFQDSLCCSALPSSA